MSKAIEKLVNGSADLNYRDRINAYYRTRGKVKLTSKDIEIIEKVEIVQEILMAHRGDLFTAKQKIKERFDLKHRQEVDRLIEDANFLLGAGFIADKGYQRMLQSQDIEYAIKIAKDTLNWDLYEKMLLRREKLYQLDQPDEVSEFNYFEVIIIQAEVKYFVEQADLDAAEEIKQRAMRKLNMVQDIEDAEFTEV